MRRGLLMLTLALAAAVTSGAAKDVEAAVRGWFGALAHDDYAAGYALQTPGFYAYDNG